MNQCCVIRIIQINQQDIEPITLANKMIQIFSCPWLISQKLEFINCTQFLGCVGHVKPGVQYENQHPAALQGDNQVLDELIVLWLQFRSDAGG